MLTSSAASRHRLVTLLRASAPASAAVNVRRHVGVCLSLAACAPSTTESAIFEANRRMARRASSLPGIT